MPTCPTVYSYDRYYYCAVLLSYYTMMFCTYIMYRPPNDNNFGLAISHGVSTSVRQLYSIVAQRVDKKLCPPPDERHKIRGRNRINTYSVIIQRFIALYSICISIKRPFSRQPGRTMYAGTGGKRLPLIYDGQEQPAASYLIYIIYIYLCMGFVFISFFILSLLFSF